MPLLLLTDEASPFQGAYQPLRIALLIVGYLLVPAVVGSVVFIALQRQVEESLLDETAAKKEIDAHFKGNNKPAQGG